MKKRFVICSAMAIFASMAIASGVLRTNTSTPAEIGVPETAFAVGDEFAVSPFPDVVFTLHISDSLPGFGGRKAYAAHLGDGVRVATLSVGDNGAFDIEIRDIASARLYRLFCRDGVCTVEEIDLAQTGRGSCIEVEAPEIEIIKEEETPTTITKMSPKLLGAVPGNPFDDNVVAPAPVMVDIMLVFDNGARAWVENQSIYDGSITNFAIRQVAKMNSVLVNTGLHTNFWYRLVDVMTVDTTYTVVDDQILGIIKNGAESGDGPYGPIKERRAACGADLVSLMIDTGSAYGTTGIGYITHGTTYNTWLGHRAWCYSCCAIRSVDLEYTLSHEVGHNMGLAHSPTLASWTKPGTFDYSNGFNFWGKDDNKPYHTIMAYDQDKNYTGYIEIPYFSSPDYTYQGTVIGTVLSNDCTRALRETCSAFAAWHDTTIPLPSDVTISPSGSEAYRITLSNLGGYEIRYTTDGTEPTRESKLYEGPIMLTSGSVTVKAVAVVAENKLGAVAEKTYTASVELNEYVILKELWGYGWNMEYWYDQDGNEKSYYYWNTSLDKTAVVDASGVLTVNRNIALGTLVANGTNSLEIVATDNALFATNLHVMGNTTLTGDKFSFENWNLHPDSTLTLSPGEGNTVTLNKYLAQGATGSTLAISNGTFSVTKGATSGDGIATLQNCALRIDNGGILSLEPGWVLGYSNPNPVTVNKGGLLKINKLESTHRPLVLNGGNVDVNLTDRAYELRTVDVTATDDSTIADKTSNGGARLYLIEGDSTFTVSEGKTLTVDISTEKEKGIIKKGQGEARFQRELFHTGTNTINAGTFTIAYNSSTTNCANWIVSSGATLKVEDGKSLAIPKLELASGAILDLPASATAPLAVSNSVALANVAFRLTGVADFELGKSYPLIAAQDGLSGIVKIDKSLMPALASGLAWKFAKDATGVLCATVVDVADARDPITIVGVDDSLALEIPDDATTVYGAVTVGENPLVVDFIGDTAVAFTLDVELPESSSATEQTICSWIVEDDNVVRCVRRADGVLDVFYGESSHANNITNSVALASGRHTIKIGYNYGDYGGTWAFVDDKPAYWAKNLKWHQKSVQALAIGATADATPRYPFAGLVLRGLGILKANSSLPLPNMTGTSGITYNYLIQNNSPTNNIPSVFPNAIAGGFSMDNSLLDASLPNSADSITVSIVASFPADKAGCLMGIWTRDTSTGSYITGQIDYGGDGAFTFSRNGYVNVGYYTLVNTPDATVDTPHLYTFKYLIDEGFEFYQDGSLILTATWGFVDKGYKVANRVDFGRGPWNKLTTGYDDNPNPMSGFKVYASHIELGSDDRSVSEAAVMESLNFDSAYDAMTIADKLAYLPANQTADGVAAPAEVPEEDLDPEPPATPAVVDVLVAYDNGAYNYVTSRSRTLEEFAQTQIERMNKVLVTNKLDRFYSYRLAGVCRVNEGYSDINNVATLVAEGEGPCASLRAAREMCGADTVTLLVNTSGSTLGNSLQIDYRDDVPGQHDCAYSVCSIAWVDSNEQYTMLHENAHTMGCGHARAQYTEDDLALDPEKYSYGYYFTDENSVNRHTIMAYGNNASPYFSTTSSEFGYKLGDSTNNNARVLKETCADVSRWRDNVKPLGDVVAATDEDGNEVFSGRLFKDTLKVTITAPVENAILYYTFDGTDPTLSNYLFTQPSPFTFNFNVTKNLKVAYYDGDKLSPVRTVKVTKCDNIPDEGIWQTSLKFPWTTDGDTVRSYNHTDYSAKNRNCTTPLSATIEGPKVLSFKHKSYFGGESVAGSNYSHFDVLLDDLPVLAQTECTNEWTEAYVDIPDGAHEVTFVFSQRYAMNNTEGDNKGGTPEADDAVWLKDIVLSDPEEPESADPCETFFEWTPGSAPTGWFTAWGGEDQGGTHNVVAPDGSWQDLYMTYYGDGSDSQKWIPWKSNANPELLDNYTFMVYGNIDDVNPSTGKLAVLWDMGFNGKQKTILAKDAAGNVKLIQANGNVIKRCINAGQVEGYHLFTVRFSTTSGASLQIDDGVIYSDSTFTQVSDKGFQVGSVLGGLPASFDRGTGFVVVKMLAFDTDSIPASQYRQLCEEYPAVTNRVLATVGETEYYRLQYLLEDLSSDSLTFTATDEMVVDVNGQTISAAISGEEFSLADNGLLVAATGENTYIIGRKAESAVLRISEIMPKPTDAQNHGALEGMDVNGLESGWVEVENTSDQWADLKDYKFIRSNRGKKTGQADYGNFPSVMIAPHSRAIFYTSERYSNSADMSVSAWATPDEGGVKPKIYTDLGNILVWPDKVNPKKSPFVRLTYTPSNTIVDTVIIPSDVPEGYSIIVGETKPGEATKRWLCPTPTRGTANTDTAGLVQIGPNVGPLYELTTGKKHDSASEFARPVPPAQPGAPYEITFSLNPVMSPTVAGGFRDEDAIASITLVYRTDLDDTTLDSVSVSLSTDVNDTKDWGHTYKTYIPADALPAPGHLIQWKFNITDASENEWTSPSFNNKDDGYEWYGTIVEPNPETQMSENLPTWHMFASGNHLTQMDVDADDQDRKLVPNQARVAIYDSSTSNYYDYVRIDLRGNTSAGFTKKGHGLRFAKAHPLTMTDVVTGETIEEIRKTSLISEFADPSYMRQMIAFWLWKKMGNLVPFDFPVRCNLNGEFYQLAFNSERFTDELIEDVYGLDKFGYGYKNVGTMKSGSSTTAGKIEKKTPDDEDESNITVLQDELRAKITAAQQVSSSPDGGDTGLDNAGLTKFVVQKFNLPAWLNYLASARITQEMDDVWANVCAYYDNAEMKEGVRGTGTWMPLGYDFNLSFGQYYYNDIKDYGNNREGLMSNQDWFKSHPLYGGNRVKAYRNSSMAGEMNGNDGFESVLQSNKFRRLYLRRLRTLMDQELKAPGTAETDTPFMAKMREMANLMRADAALDLAQWPDNGSDDAIDVWPSNGRPANMDAGINDIWDNYVVPRREHLYVTHSVTNAATEIGYGSSLNAGIPEAQSPVEALAPNISISNLTALDAAEAEALGVAGQLYDTEVVVIRNDNDEVVDMSGWRLAFSVDFTFPAGTVCDANDSIYVVADRRAYIDAHDAELTDQVIIGNATFTGAGPIALYDADGALVYSAIPQTSELKYLRLHSFYGNTFDGGDAGEWFTLTNISDSVTLDLADVTVCFLKQGDDHDTTEHCHVTLENKKHKGEIAPLGSMRFDQADYADKGWVKIQNNKQQITIYDKYGSVCQSLKVTQKSFDLAYGKGGYLVCDSVDPVVDTKKDTDWHQELAGLPNDGEGSAEFAADSQEAADAVIAGAEVVLTPEDEKAGLETQYLKVVAEPVEGEAGKYKAVVVVNPETVYAPAIAEPTTEEAEPVSFDDDGETGGKTVTITLKNAVMGLWYGYEVSDSLGDGEAFENDNDSFMRATGTTFKMKPSSPRDSSKPSGFFRVKVLPSQPKNSD